MVLLVTTVVLQPYDFIRSTNGLSKNIKFDEVLN